MLCEADAIGVFQVESRAQMNMLPRLRPRKFYDLVVEVAIVRPGPIQGGMVHPYLQAARSNPSTIRKWFSIIPSPVRDTARMNCKNVLNKTLGVPLFQEQAMKLAIVAAKFTPDEANGLRRAMATFRHVGTIGNFEEKFIDGMIERGYDREFRRSLFRADQGLRLLRFSRKPCRQLCAAGLCLGLDQETSSRRLRRGAAQFPAHGLLCPRRDRALRPRA